MSSRQEAEKGEKFRICAYVIVRFGARNSMKVEEVPTPWGTYQLRVRGNEGRQYFEVGTVLLITSTHSVTY